MDHYRCMRFGTLRSFYPDELNLSTERDIHSIGGVVKYCPNGGSKKNECKTDLDKIKAGFLWLFEQIIVNNIDSLSKDQIEIFTIYIIMWFSYMLNLKNVKEFNNINEFYDAHIKNITDYINCNTDGKECNSILKNNLGYNNFKEIIDKKKDLLSINLKDMSNFYGAFKLLCIVHTEFDANKPECTKYIENAKNFVEKYNELNNGSDITESSPYYQVLSTLSKDYNNFKKYCNENKGDCNDIPSLLPIKTKENAVQSSAHDNVQNYGVTSSSPSIANKLIPFLLILATIPIFLGVSYKYSLFGFRKRSQKHIREKLKK
ncbi:PIR protein [Plasmodium yoelii]|uniref:PIR protein n=2 Tax=Plasmodium yoelii TaxID=5861 RepID=A0AAE9WKF5_PLAYO|nr:PIR protein [Plasmodium yoelii]WBY55211.1 PIR protein [Plasmodium yoelii yoelii]CDU16397.1 YIR protein [Plasmodium yoelii]VTZ73134.1 PIR protein [Plasmodium yoelii]|eukprot:XP_022811517.1 PIR protein [Plasmodium yoelii]